MLSTWLLVLSLPQPARALDKLFFLHHSTGRYLLAQGEVRQLIAGHNASQGTSLELWDHDYNPIGLADATGSVIGRSYDIPNDDTDPVGLH